MIDEIIPYRQKDGTDILKVVLVTTKKFPNGYFHCDANAEDIVRKYNWRLQSRNNAYVIAHDDKKTLRFHREFINNLFAHQFGFIDHRDGVEYDNISENLRPVTRQQNRRNTPTCGYLYCTEEKNFRFRIQLWFEGRCWDKGSLYNEYEAILRIQEVRETEYADYDYDFFVDRRNDKDILDLERTGQITAEEATYQHVIRYVVNNAWYYYRYGLQEYFKDNKIPIPDFDLDSDGFMVDKITRKRLCPF